jgi:hypothetical protein
MLILSEDTTCWLHLGNSHPTYLGRMGGATVSSTTLAGAV